MAIRISGAPCSWGVDDPQNPYLPPWRQVLSEAAQAGYAGIELGPYGYVPMETETVKKELDKNGLHIVAGTIFSNLVSEENFETLQRQVDDIGGLVAGLPRPKQEPGQKFAAPYLVLIDWGHEERDYAAGHPGKAPRLGKEARARMAAHIKALARQAGNKYGMRAVVHPHAGGYIEFADEIDALLQDVEYDVAGLCLDTGHLYYSGMNPLEWLDKYYDRLDYIHFKDINLQVYKEVMQEKIRFFDACAKGVMCPIGEGEIPYRQIYKLLRKKGYAGYITIEQERDPRNAGGSLQDVQKSLAYLHSVGF